MAYVTFSSCVQTLSVASTTFRFGYHHTSGVDTTTLKVLIRVCRNWTLSCSSSVLNPTPKRYPFFARTSSSASSGMTEPSNCNSFFMATTVDRVGHLTRVTTSRCRKIELEVEYSWFTYRVAKLRWCG